MLFNSFEFLMFLPIVWAAYWFVFRRLRWQNFFIVCASYVFYGWWDWRFLVLIAITTVLSFGLGRVVAESPRCSRLATTVNILLNLGILGVFKYYNFFAESFAQMFGGDAVTLNVILPVGISFYTFQALSYTIDVYKGKIPACRDFVAFCAYISFFPQLVAGPIERSTNLLPQFARARVFNYGMAVDGCRQILWGLFKKMIVADNCAWVVNTVFENPGEMSPVSLAMGAVFFTFQIYGDFSGYSDIAIGTAKLFGIRLMRNFAFPYFSRDIAEFWRRWHISLTTWFRDYIYIPLGGSRCSTPRVMRNTLIIFLVSGLWHGANWTFIAWGAYHAVLFFPLMLLGKNRRHTTDHATWRDLPAILGTFALAALGWVIFRADSIGQAWHYVVRMLTTAPMDGRLVFNKISALYILILLAVEWLQRRKQHAFEGLPLPAPVRYVVYVALAIYIINWRGSQAEFIYFQF